VCFTKYIISAGSKKELNLLSPDMFPRIKMVNNALADLGSLQRLLDSLTGLGGRDRKGNERSGKREHEDGRKVKWKGEKGKGRRVVKEEMGGDSRHCRTTRSDIRNVG